MNTVAVLFPALHTNALEKALDFALELLLFLEKHAEADDGCVDQQAPSDRHSHGTDANQIGVGENNRESYREWGLETFNVTRSPYVRTNAHHHQESRAEPAQVNDGRSGVLDEVIGVGAAAADPVRQRGYHVGSDDEERIVDLP